MCARYDALVSAGASPSTLSGGGLAALVVAHPSAAAAVVRSGADVPAVECCVVSGAGTAGANGVYLRAGEERGKPAFVKDAEWRLADWGNWCVWCGGDAMYYEKSKGALPAPGGWRTDDGASPAPSVAHLTSLAALAAQCKAEEVLAALQ